MRPSDRISEIYEDWRCFRDVNDITRIDMMIDAIIEYLDEQHEEQI